MKSPQQRKTVDIARHRSPRLLFLRRNRAVKGFTRRAQRTLDDAIFSGSVTAVTINAAWKSEKNFDRLWLLGDQPLPEQLEAQRLVKGEKGKYFLRVPSTKYPPLREL